MDAPPGKIRPPSPPFYAKTAAHAEIERKVQVAVQRKIEANSIHSKLDNLSKGHFTKMSIKEYLDAQHLDDDGWFEKLSELRSLLPKRRAEYEEASTACTQLEAKYELAQSKHEEARAISDNAKHQHRKTSAANDNALALLQSAQKDLAKCQLVEDDFSRAVRNRKLLGLAALMLVVAGVVNENIIITSKKSWSFIPSACIEILITRFHIDDFSWFFRPAASAMFILASTCAFWGLLSAFHMAKDSSDFKNRRLAAADVVNQAAATRDSLEREARGDKAALTLAEGKTESASQGVSMSKLNLDKGSKNKDDKHTSLTACETQLRQHQLHFDREERKYNKQIAEDERLHNESFASKRDKSLGEARDADDAASGAYEVASASWTSFAAADDEGTSTKTKQQPAATGNFETFFKQKLLEEERRRKEREREVQRLAEQLREQRRREQEQILKDTVSANHSSSPRSYSGSDWSCVGAAVRQMFTERDPPTRDESRFQWGDKSPDVKCAQQ